MSVKTSDRMLHETVSRRAVVDSPDSQSRVRSAPRPGQDPYPTRLAEPLDMPWLNRREEVVKGRAEEGPLSQAQLDEFDRKGFLFEPNFISGEELDELRRELAALLERDDFRGRDFAITEPSGNEIRSLFAVHFLSERLGQLARDARLVGRARQILGGEPYVHQSRINYKPGFEGKGFNWHSDFETWHAEDGMPRMRALSMSVLLAENTPYNGPLMMIPGSHRTFITCVGETPDDHYRQSLKKQEYGVPDELSLAVLAHKHGIVAPTGQPGTVIVFDCNTMHGSNGNITPCPRSNAFLVYNAVSNRLEKPFGADKPRPEFIAAREVRPISPHRGLIDKAAA